MHPLACEPSRLADGQFRQHQRQPRAGSWTLMQSHFRDVICGGDDRKWQELSYWMAQLLQYPEKKPCKAVVLRGGRATGKSTAAEFLREIVGQNHSLTVSHCSDISGPFNPHLRHCLFLIVEEDFVHGDQAAERVLSDLITAPTLMIETMGMAPARCRNFTRVMIVSHEAWTVPATAEEGRYLVFDVVKLFEGDADAAEKRRAYFKALHDEASNGGLEAMMADLLQLDSR